MTVGNGGLVAAAAVGRRGAPLQQLVFDSMHGDVGDGLQRAEKQKRKHAVTVERAPAFVAGTGSPFELRPSVLKFVRESMRLRLYQPMITLCAQ